MARVRGGGVDQRPEGAEAWALLNEALYGSPDVGGYHAAPKPSALPVDWPAVFGRDAPRTLEIGFNRGRFLRGLAKRWPECDHVGVEVRRRFAWMVAYELGTLPDQPRNIRVIWGDAKIVCPVVFGEGSLSHIFITFPDPWWKKKHEKRRLVDGSFAPELVSLLKPGGRIWVKSDVALIADEIREALVAQPNLGPVTPFEQDDLPLTYRETGCIAKGMPIIRFFLDKLA